MSYTTDEQQRYDETRAFARNALVELAHAGEPGELNRSLVRAMGERGMLARLFPRHVGGVHDTEVSAIDLCLLREAVACESPEAETALAMQGLGSYPLLQSGTEEIVQEWMPKVCAGEAIPAFALSEPGAGSDAAALSLRATRIDGGWRLDGTKTWISNAPGADVYSLFARTSDDGSRGVSAFCVPGGLPGLSGQHLDLLSPHPIGTVVCDGVEIPDSHLLGSVGEGFKVAMRTLDLFRPSVGAFAVGMAQSALELALDHCAERQAFGGPLKDLQAVAHRLADMAVGVHTARLAVLDAARGYDGGRPGQTNRSSMAKLYATETAQRVVDDAVQLHGAVALVKGHRLEALYRDVRAPRIYEGASEVQRTIIARGLYKERSSTPPAGRPK